MMEYKNKIDLHELAREVFCEELIMKAGFAYSSWRIKQNVFTKYYFSDNNELIYSQVRQVGDQAKSDLLQYIQYYSKLCRVYLNSPLTDQQAKKQAKSILKTYLGPAGDQVQFKRYFRDLIDSRFHNLDYVSDSSDDEDDVKTPSTSLVHTSFSSSSNFSLSVCIPDYEEESVEDQMNERGFFIDNNDEESTGAFVTHELMPVYEPCQAINASSFSHRKATGKRVTFFDEVPIIQLEHKESITPDMLEWESSSYNSI